MVSWQHGKTNERMGRAEKLLPKGWEEKAKENKAICRTRKVGSAEELLRVELLHFGEGLSLKETSAVAKEGGISDISSVALYPGEAAIWQGKKALTILLMPVGILPCV